MTIYSNARVDGGQRASGAAAFGCAGRVGRVDRRGWSLLAMIQPINSPRGKPAAVLLGRAL